VWLGLLILCGLLTQGLRLLRRIGSRP
jgi:hypothetical protein